MSTAAPEQQAIAIKPDLSSNRWLVLGTQLALHLLVFGLWEWAVATG